MKTLSMIDAIRRALYVPPPQSVQSHRIVLTPLGMRLFETEAYAADMKHHAEHIRGLSEMTRGSRVDPEFPDAPTMPDTPTSSIFGVPVTVEDGAGIGYVEATTGGGALLCIRIAEAVPE